MKYVLGIDSGGTKFLVRACAQNGEPLAEYTGSPAGHYRFERAEALRRINDNIDRCLETFGGRREDCLFLVCGTTGLDSRRDQAVVEGIYGSLSGFSCPVFCANDAQVALYAVTGGVGAVVIAGTGSIAFGRSAEGRLARCGGWPPCIFGDDGSGTWIARKALYHLSLLLDGRVPPTRLSELLDGAVHVRTAEDLIGICIDIEHNCWHDPGLTRLVDQAAEQGDPFAAEILQSAARHTFALGDAVIRQLKLHSRPSFKVGAWGSAIVKSRTHFSAFREMMLAKYPGAEVNIAREDAAMGACRMALDHLNGRIDLFRDYIGWKEGGR